MDEQLLKDVRKWVIKTRAKQTSWAGFRLGEAVLFAGPGNKKPNRGHVQACLGILATEGLIFTRRKPEDMGWKVTHMVDKIFTIRISQKEAIKRLSKMKD